MAAKNPPLVVFNPPRRAGWKKIAAHVQAIIYRHADDQRDYVHGFGGRDPSQAELASGQLDLGALAGTTGVEAFWSPDKKEILLKHKSGKPLIGLF